MAIIRLPAPSNNFGYTETVGPPYLYGYYGKPANLKNACERSGQSTNLMTLLRSGTPWRSPSSYSRFVRVFENVKSSRKGSLAGGWSVPGDNLSGAILMTNCSGFWQNTSAIVSSDTLNESDTKALLDVGNGKATIGIALAEAKRTYQLIAGSALTLLDAYRQARKGHWKAVERILGLNGTGKVLLGKYPANKWLEYQYGWKPLLSDIHDAYGILRGSLAADAYLIHGKGGSNRTRTFESDSYSSTQNITYLKKYEAEQVIITRLSAQLTSERWRQAGQVGLVNPLSIAWEVVPFSFLVDWFMPIGNVLEALTARAGLTWVGGSRTVLTGGSCNISCKSWGGSLLVAGTLRLRYFRHDRTKLYGWPKPFIYARESPFSTTRSLNALALWRGTLRYR